MAKYSLAAVVAELKAEHESIEIETEHRTFTVPPPQLWPDAVIDAAQAPVEAAKALLGDQYPDWLAEGGSAAVLMEIVSRATGADQGNSSGS